MDGAAFKLALAKLGYTQTSFAREHGFPIRTVQNWARRGVPDHMAFALNAWVRMIIDPPDPSVWSKGPDARFDGARAMDAAFQSVLERAVRSGWPRDLVISAALEWWIEQLPIRR